MFGCYALTQKLWCIGNGYDALRLAEPANRMT